MPDPAAPEDETATSAAAAPAASPGRGGLRERRCAWAHGRSRGRSGSRSRATAHCRSVRASRRPEPEQAARSDACRWSRGRSAEPAGRSVDLAALSADRPVDRGHSPEGAVRAAFAAGGPIWAEAARGPFHHSRVVRTPSLPLLPPARSPENSPPTLCNSRGRERLCRAARFVSRCGRVEPNRRPRRIRNHAPSGQKLYGIKAKG